ncbi:unspecific monooxygenase [Saccharopolyspora erythraea NRRL 2338]|uniref:Cytochrome P450 n=2 Tax=Saccharopolyspora erythraea TaxID=1836 RepID=A4F604_SACEN|nr:cytochrome P450 [Saccharopolyspora erythraea]EQD83764.1 cytochrome P450 [Saccharopolyspora erythraea D]PFG93277.1 unspecific monooxygenase [Saccharopolyspora erythraea NRRL 2338]QRK90126.1 cytochrome P450 [Saccharopolyspora erythraea]CAL99478.1 putative cytochrome P450 [Saccharopolyspora erythraea NRRL 2338]
MFDTADPAFVADPYPCFAELRRRGEVHRHPGLGMAVAVSHAAASEVLRHRGLGRIWVDAQPAADFPAFNLLHRTSLLETEGAEHTRLRRSISAAFARGHVERVRPWVAGLADALVGGLVERGGGDVVEEVAAPLPVQVIAELLGVPESDRNLLRPWSNAIVKMYEPGLPERRRAAAESAAAEFAEYMRALADRRRSAPADDMVSDLVAAEELSADEVVGTAVLLLMAGHEASVNLVANGVLALLRHPGQWRRLVDDPGLVPTAVEELIRYDSPLQLFERTAVEDVVVAGHRVAAGSKIAALLGAAARDPEVFESPDVLDVGRQPNPHLGFGAGIHYCLGAPLARVEAAAALSALVRLAPRLEQAGEPVRRPEFVIRGLRELPVSV